MNQFSLKYTPNISTAQPLRTDFKPPRVNLWTSVCMAYWKKIRHHLIKCADLRYLSDNTKTKCFENSTCQFSCEENIENRSKQQLWAKPKGLTLPDHQDSTVSKKKVKNAKMYVWQLEIKAINLKYQQAKYPGSLEDRRRRLKRGCTAHQQAENSKCGLIEAYISNTDRRP